MKLGRFGIVSNPLLEFSLRGVEFSDHHQVAAQDLVRLRVLNIELQRLCQGLNRFAEFLFCEIAVAERIPSPGRVRVLLNIVGKRRFHFLKTVFPDVALELGDFS